MATVFKSVPLTVADTRGSRWTGLAEQGWGWGEDRVRKTCHTVTLESWPERGEWQGSREICNRVHWNIITTPRDKVSWSVCAELRLCSWEGQSALPPAPDPVLPCSYCSRWLWSCSVAWLSSLIWLKVSIPSLQSGRSFQWLSMQPT